MLSEAGLDEEQINKILDRVQEVLVFYFVCTLLTAACWWGCFANLNHRCCCSSSSSSSMPLPKPRGASAGGFGVCVPGRAVLADRLSETWVRFQVGHEWDKVRRPSRPAGTLSQKFSIY